MTLTDLAGAAESAPEDQITLSPSEARDIVSQADDADERCHALAARVAELEQALAERDATIAAQSATIASLHDTGGRLLAAFTRLNAGVIALTEKLGAALDPHGVVKP